MKLMLAMYNYTKQLRIFYDCKYQIIDEDFFELVTTAYLTKLCISLPIPFALLITHVTCSYRLFAYLFLTQRIIYLFLKLCISTCISLSLNLLVPDTLYSILYLYLLITQLTCFWNSVSRLVSPLHFEWPPPSPPLVSQCAGCTLEGMCRWHPRSQEKLFPW